MFMSSQREKRRRPPGTPSRGPTWLSRQISLHPTFCSRRPTGPRCVGAQHQQHPVGLADDDYLDRVAILGVNLDATDRSIRSRACAAPSSMLTSNCPVEQVQTSYGMEARQPGVGVWRSPGHGGRVVAVRRGSYATPSVLEGARSRDPGRRRGQRTRQVIRRCAPRRRRGLGRFVCTAAPTRAGPRPGRAPGHGPLSHVARLGVCHLGIELRFVASAARRSTAYPALAAALPPPSRARASRPPLRARTGRQNAVA